MKSLFFLIIVILVISSLISLLTFGKLGFVESLIATIFFLLIFANFYSKTNKKSKNSSTSKKINTTNITSQDIAYEWPSQGDFEFDVVGEANYQDSIKSIVGDHGDDTPSEIFKALIIPENDNKYDHQAVRIDVNSKTVGYLSREDARSFRRRLSSKKISIKITSCNAGFTGGYIKSDGIRASYGVRLDIKPFY